jgi:hypothetical protein
MFPKKTQLSPVSANRAPQINLARKGKKVTKHLIRIIIKLKNESKVPKVTFLGHGNNRV